MFFPALSISVIVLFVDQISKLIILDILKDGPKVITSNFNIVEVYNTGISFSLFRMDSTIGQWILSGLAGIIVVFLLIWISRVKSRIHSLALGGIIGGAIGNISDRIFRGAVVDFIDIHAFNYHWPAFNFADSAIVVCVFVVIFLGFFSKQKSDI